MRKKIINVVIIFVLCITIISPMDVTTYASTSPDKITSDIVNQRISQLQTLCGMRFTVNGELCYRVDHATIDCGNCNVKNVLQKNTKVRNLIKKYKGGYSPSPISNLPYHMIDASGSTSSYGDSCFGFASFAGWYIFASKYTDKVVFNSIKTNLNYNYSNVKKYVKPGDIIRFENKHSAIVISIGSNSVKVLHANWPSTSALKNSSRVSVDSISYTTYSKIGISRATNYSTNSTLTVKSDNIESSGKPYIYWTSHTGASKYKVYSKRISSNTYTYRGYTTKTSFTDTTAVPSYNYMYKIQAIDSKGNILKTDYEQRSCALAKPEMTGITNVESTGAIKGYFKGVKYANKYKVYRSTSKNGPYSFVFSLSTEMCKGGESLRFINTSTTPGKTYYYKIQAVNTNNTEADSDLSGYMYRTRDLAMPSIKITGDSYGRNVLSWSEVPGADQYEVYRSTNESDYTRIYRGTSTKVTNTKNLVNGTKYYYKVRAIDNSNSYANSAYSDPVSRTYNSQLKLTAENVASSGKIKLSWTPYPGASKYYIYVKKPKETSYTRLISTTSTSIVNTSAVPSYLYTYYVSAVNKDGEIIKSSDKIQRSCDLAKPEMTGITNVESTGAIKGYFKGVKYANKYKVYRSTSKNGPYSFVFSLSTEMCKGGESLYFINTSTTPGKTYYYKIQAVNTNNTGADSALSGYMYRTRDLAMPSVKITGDSYGRNVLSWSEVPGADQYEVYRSTNESDYTRIYRGTSTKVTNTKNLVNGTKYYYKVRAIDNSNSYANSAYSDLVSRTYSK